MRRALLSIIIPMVLVLTVRDVRGQSAVGGEIVPAPELRQSPTMLSTARIDNGRTYVKIVYGSPRMRNRTIFGGLVPFDRVWRTGANEATELTVTGAITFAGEPVEAGTYALFTIPGENSWIVILNKGLGQWGAYEYDSSLDYLRVDVPVEKTNATYEALTIDFDEKDHGIDLVINWEQTRVRIPIRPR